MFINALASILIVITNAIATDLVFCSYFFMISKIAT